MSYGTIIHTSFRQSYYVNSKSEAVYSPQLSHCHQLQTFVSFRDKIFDKTFFAKVIKSSTINDEVNPKATFAIIFKLGQVFLIYASEVSKSSILSKLRRISL